MFSFRKAKTGVVKDSPISTSGIVVTTYGATI
jgi:hypothetical protein